MRNSLEFCDADKDLEMIPKDDFTFFSDTVFGHKTKIKPFAKGLI